MPGRVTIRDVAARAGVSPATVSFVLNETPGQVLRPETRTRVREAAAELGYTPHRIAQALREGRSRFVLLKTGPLRERGGSLGSYIAGLEDELRRHGHTLLVTSGQTHDELLETVAPRTVMDLTRIYFQGEGADLDDGGWVDGLAAHTATQLEALLAAGHSRIAVAIPAGHADERLAQLRVAHARQFLASREGAGSVVIEIPTRREEAVEVMRGLRARHPEVTAVAAFSDDVAFMVLAAMSAAGLSVPDDLAVIGFDESTHAALWQPALTTVRIDAEVFGRRAARAALGLDAGPWAAPSSRVVRGETV